MYVYFFSQIIDVSISSCCCLPDWSRRHQQLVPCWIHCGLFGNGRERARGPKPVFGLHSLSPVFWHQVSNVVLFFIHDINSWSFSWWWLKSFQLIEICILFSSRCPIVICLKATGPLEYISATVILNLYIKFCKPNSETWSAFCRRFWLLSIYMDHGDIQKKKCFYIYRFFHWTISNGYQ